MTKRTMLPQGGKVLAVFSCAGHRFQNCWRIFETAARQSNTSHILIMFSFILPDAVQNVPVGKHPDVQVWLYDVVELPVLLVAEEGVGHPDLAGVSQGQVLHLACMCRRTKENSLNNLRVAFTGIYF